MESFDSGAPLRHGLRHSAIPRSHHRNRRRAFILLGALMVLATPGQAQLPSVADPAAAAPLRALIVANPELEARRAALVAAEARLAATGFAPAATLDAEIEEVPGGVNVLDAGSAQIAVSREFLPGGLRKAQREVARQDVARAQLELALHERALVARADQFLVEAAAASAVASRLAAEDSLLSGAEEALRGRFAVGDARYVDVLRLRSERLRVQSERARTAAEARVARRSLLALVGAGDNAVAVIDRAIALQGDASVRGILPAAPPVDSLVGQAGATQLASAAVARAQAAQRLARARQRPHFAASVGIQRFERDEGGHRVGPTIGASVSLPFTARRANQAALTASQHEVQAAEAERLAAIAHVRTELATAIERYEAARSQLALFDASLLRAAREEREGALASYRSGELSLIELLDFERALARAEIDRLRNQMEAAHALADLVAGVAGIDEDTHGQTADERLGDDR